MPDIKIGTLVRARKTYWSGGYEKTDGGYQHTFDLKEGSVGWIRHLHARNTGSIDVAWLDGNVSHYARLSIPADDRDLIEIVEETNGADV